MSLTPVRPPSYPGSLGLCQSAVSIRIVRNQLLEDPMAAHIDYYVSLNSPWTHLGAARIEAMAQANNATLHIFPVDFGAIFAQSGGLPLPKRSPQRQAYRLQELARWHDHLGIPIIIQPKFFPSSEQQTTSCVIALRETMGNQPAINLAHRVLKALWQEEKNPADPATLAALITEIGLDADQVMTLGSDPKWAEMRLADTKAALDKGVFGAPSYVIGDEIFWGQDRLSFVERRLAGI
jgi:2-hydroxychromene-2-carboxylate isomerase